jgi:hypothetical protein
MKEYLEIIMAILVTVLAVGVIGGVVTLGFFLYKIIKDED